MSEYWKGFKDELVNRAGLTAAEAQTFIDSVSSGKLQVKEKALE
jgi:hypothetical protein